MEVLGAIAAVALAAFALYWGIVLLLEVAEVLWGVLIIIFDALVSVGAAILFVVFFPITVPLFLWAWWKEYKAERNREQLHRLSLSLLREATDLQRRIGVRTPQPKPPPIKADWSNPKPQKKGYTSDWGSVSNRYKKAQGWRCEHCGVYCGGPGDTPLLHVHHWDRNPQNNRDTNLVALCIQCHSRQPGAGHKRLRTAAKNDGRWQRITRLREK